MLLWVLIIGFKGLEVIILFIKSIIIRILIAMNEYGTDLTYLSLDYIIYADRKGDHEMKRELFKIL